MSLNNTWYLLYGLHVILCLILLGKVEDYMNIYTKKLFSYLMKHNHSECPSSRI